MKSFLFLTGFWLFAIIPFIKAFIPGVIPEAEWPYYFEIKKYEQCDEYPNTKVLFRNARIDRTAMDNYTVSGVIDVTEDLQAPQYMGVKILKCKDEKMNCKHVFSQVLQDLCEDMKNKRSKGYEIMHDHLEFKETSCPIKKGVHEIVSKPFDTKAFQATGGVAEYWKISLYFYEADKKTASSCVYFEVAIHKKGQRQKPRPSSNSRADKSEKSDD